MLMTIMSRDVIKNCIEEAKEIWVYFACINDSTKKEIKEAD